jgi:hypothetical protein
MASVPQQPALEKYISRVPAQLVQGQTPLVQEQAKLVRLALLSRVQTLLAQKQVELVQLVRLA